MNHLSQRIMKYDAYHRVAMSLCILVTLLVGVTGCRKQDAVYQEFLQQGVKIYIGQVDSIHVVPGKNRVKVQWKAPLDPKATHVKIYWNNKRDSTQVAIPVNRGTGWGEATIDQLAEGMHTFDLVTVDAHGNTSLVSQGQGRAYGAVYESQLQAKRIGSMSYTSGNVTLGWPLGSNNSVGGELFYEDSAEKTHRLELGDENADSRLTDYRIGSTVRYRERFLPAPHSLDTFYSAFVELILPLTHFQDKELDKSRFAEYALPGDPLAWNSPGNTLSNLWSGVLAGWPPERAWFRTENGSGKPHHFQFDLGVDVKPTKLAFWQRGVITEHSIVYANGNLKRYEIWGATAPDPDGSYSGWTKLLTCTSIKPSGLPLGENSAEDIAYAAAGERYEFPDDVPAIRYLRVKVLETWADTDFMHMAEISIWGDYWGF